MYAAYLAPENSEPAKRLKHDAGSDHSNLFERHAMANARFYVYVHRRADSGEVFYVGKGKNQRAYCVKRRGPYWDRIVEKHGVSIEIVEHFDEERDAFDRECALIAQFRAAGVALANLTDGGDGASGAKRSAETRARMSASNKGKRLGRKESAETRAKLSAIRKGRKISPEAVAKTAAFHRGRNRSPETLAKMSAALKGKNVGRRYSEETRAKLGAARRGHKHSDETRAKMSAKQRGSKKKPHSAETRAKMSAAKIRYWAERKANAAA